MQRRRNVQPFERYGKSEKTAVKGKFLASSIFFIQIDFYSKKYVLKVNTEKENAMKEAKSINQKFVVSQGEWEEGVNNLKKTIKVIFQNFRSNSDKLKGHQYNFISH